MVFKKSLNKPRGNQKP